MDLVVVGMSGGVDSSVAAKLLADQVSQVVHHNRSLTILEFLGLRLICSVHAKLGYPRRIRDRQRLRVGKRLGRRPTSM